jgi:hypothetical protein
MRLLDAHKAVLERSFCANRTNFSPKMAGSEISMV